MNQIVLHFVGGFFFHLMISPQIQFSLPDIYELSINTRQYLRAKITSPDNEKDVQVLHEFLENEKEYNYWVWKCKANLK